MLSEGGATERIDLLIVGRRVIAEGGLVCQGGVIAGSGLWDRYRKSVGRMIESLPLRPQDYAQRREKRVQKESSQNHALKGSMD